MSLQKDLKVEDIKTMAEGKEYPVQRREGNGYRFTCPKKDYHRVAS